MTPILSPWTHKFDSESDLEIQNSGGKNSKLDFFKSEFESVLIPRVKNNESRR